MELVFLVVGLFVGLIVMYFIQRGSQQSQDVQAALQTQKAQLSQQYEMQFSKMREKQGEIENNSRTQKAQYEMQLSRMREQQSQIEVAFQTQQVELTKKYETALSKSREEQSQMEISFRTQQAELTKNYEIKLSQTQEQQKALLSKQHQAELAKMREQQSKMEIAFLTQQAELKKKHEVQQTQMKEQQKEKIQIARKDSVDRSRSVLKGKVAEQMAPILPGFDYSPSDARFVGDPIDYLIFSGYTAVKDDKESGDHLEVVIADIKRGKSRLSTSQRAIARAVEAGRVRFEVMRVDDDGRIERRTWRSRSRRS